MNVETTITKTTTIELTEEQAAKIIRDALDAPEKAAVEFDCGYEYLRSVTITWTEISD